MEMTNNKCDHKNNYFCFGNVLYMGKESPVGVYPIKMLMCSDCHTIVGRTFNPFATKEDAIKNGYELKFGK